MKPPFQRLVALLVLAAFCATMGARAIDTQHALGADPDISPALHSEGQLPSELLVQEVATPESATFDEHCALCHWARTFSNTMAAEPVRDAAPGRIDAFVARHSSSIRSGDTVSAPPRGPPSLD